MRKHGYGYLEEIIVRRADNALYRFKECDFPRLWINDIEDMLLLVVQNWLTNLSGDDVADFAIALRMFTRSLAIQKHQQAAKGKKDDEILEKIFVVVDLLTETQTDAKKNMTSSYCAIISKFVCFETFDNENNAEFDESDNLIVKRFDTIRFYRRGEELSDEQALHPNTDQSASSPVKIEALLELPKCLELEAELIKQHNIVEKDEYNRLLKRFSELEQHCISLEIAMQLNKEIFQKNNTSVNQTEPLFDQLFELNNLKAELQAKYMTIKKLKAHIKRIDETSNNESVKKDLDEIETINIELEHREKVFVITTLKNDLRKVKGKDIVDNATQMSNDATIAPGMRKLDPVVLAPKVKNNREAHEYYLKHSMEQAAILREVVKQAKLRNPLDSTSYSACIYVKLIQELLGYIRDTCPDIYKPSEKLVAVTPINKKRIARFADTVTSSGNILKVTNRPLLSSTGVKPSTSASGLKPSGNTKNDRIS
ncbi:hypothetical protein Tco_0320384 [Tanacetum coccineum]